MTPDDAKRLDALFAAALELRGDERERYLEEQCGTDAQLTKTVRRLLAAAETDDDSLGQRFGHVRERLLQEVLGGDESDAQVAEDLSGLRVDVWRLERRVARGGLATVYLAQRDDGEYDQRVAFKVLRRGLDTDDLVARFRAERQILSALDHPAIAGILDGGALEDGRPYLVLEYVDGQTITEYARDRELGVRERVRLVLDVLGALHHAHRHLIVHRDIKPSNILVSNDGHVTLLDFGIAKLLDPGALPGASTLTRTGVSLQTPGYSSPEQRAGEPVTTASDIYQAGTVLYELLAGARPRLADRDAGAPPPSQALKGKPGYAAVRGDLDAIIGKAMHPDPSRRYASADEMAGDLKRYLDGRPVTARPDTLGYRLGKLHRRKPWLLPAAALALLAVAGYVYTLASYNAQLQKEQQRLAAAQAFMIDVLASPDPFRPADPDLGRNITVVDALDLGRQRLETDLLDDPELRESVLASIADVYANLDQHEKAIALREEALAIERELHGELSEPVLASLQQLAKQYRAISDYEAAGHYADLQLATARQLYGDDDTRLGIAEVDYAARLNAEGRPDEAKPLYRQGIARLRRAPEEHAEPLIEALLALANLLRFEANDESLALIDEAAGLSKALYGETSLSMGLVRSQRASTLSAGRAYEEAAREFEAALGICEAHLGRNHGLTIATVNNLGILYNRMGETARAEELYREVLERRRSKHGEQHRAVADGYQNLATAVTRAGRYRESIPMHQQAYEIYRAVLPGDHAVIAYPMLSRAYAEIRLADYAAAEASARTALGILERSAERPFVVGVAQCLVALSLQGQGQVRAGDELLAAAHERLVGSGVSPTYRELCRVPDG